MSDLYVFTGPGECRERDCRAPILWFRTPLGKNLCINDGAPELPVMEHGRTFTSEEAKSMILPHNHWATCPKAEKFRKPR